HLTSLARDITLVAKVLRRISGKCGCDLPDLDGSVKPVQARNNQFFLMRAMPAAKIRQADVGYLRAGFVPGHDEGQLAAFPLSVIPCDSPVPLEAFRVESLSTSRWPWRADLLLAASTTPVRASSEEHDGVGDGLDDGGGAHSGGHKVGRRADWRLHSRPTGARSQVRSHCSRIRSPAALRSADGERLGGLLPRL